MKIKTKEKADFFFYSDLNDCRNNISTRKPVNHQERAIIELNKWFNLEEFPAGTIMVLPTGSGKTFTAVRFLCQGPLSKGYKVLWLAHTHHLLEQAFFSFIPKDKDKGGFEVGWITEPKDDIKIRVVSGAPDNFKVNQIKKTDDIVIATLQSITNAYKNKHPQLEDFLKSADGKLFVVFDEAHHAPAPTYRKLLIGDDHPEIRESLRERFPEMYLLGLTATPTYNNEEKRGWLKEIFPQEIIYQAEIKNLIFEKILAKPNTIESKTDIEQELDEKEYLRLVRDYEKDIPQKMIKGLASNKNRNQYIVDSYVKNKDDYGKTIIFADRWEQCEYLNKLLLDQKIRSDVMYAGQGRQRYNDVALEKFRNNELDVIINIRMLTEGTDVPDVSTVFLTRQTTSEILLTQMVGRALRGPRFGGSEEANLVFFIDNWKQQINWATWDPNIWGAKRELGGGPIDPPPWDLISVKLIQDLIDKMVVGENIAGSFSASMPIGWYQVNFFKSNENKDSDGNDGKARELVMVFNDNYQQYQNLIQYLIDRNFEKFDNEDINLDDCEEEINTWNEKFFSPVEEQIDRDIIRNIFRIALHIAQDKDNNAPVFIEFKERDKYDLDAIAREFVEADYGSRTVDERLKMLYKDENQIWSTLYYNFDFFKSQYYSSVEWILNPPKDTKYSSEEDELVKKLLDGSPKEKIESCLRLTEIATHEAIHEDTMEKLIHLSEHDDNLDVRRAAENAVNQILSIELSDEDKRRIKKRDGYKCLCCGEDVKYRLQVDHINPRYFGIDNSDNNLQTLCSVCNGYKGTKTLDFRITKTSLKSPIEEFNLIRYIENAKDSQIMDIQWWEKLFRRHINFYYHCGATKTFKINGPPKNLDNFEIELHSGNPMWVMQEIKKMLPHIQYARESLNYDGPNNISIILSDASDKFDENSEVLIIPAKYAIEEYLEHSVYICQPNRAFRPVEYIGFYVNGKIDKRIPKILGQIENVKLSKRDIPSNLDLNIKKRLLELIESLERKDITGRLGYNQKIFFLSKSNSDETLKLKQDIINDTKSKSGKNIAFTQNQRYIPLSKFKDNPKKTSSLL